MTAPATKVLYEYRESKKINLRFKLYKYLELAVNNKMVLKPTPR